MKCTQRIDYARFTDALVERGLVQRETMNEVLERCNELGTLLGEQLVSDELVADWELSKFVCDLYNLPFLTVEGYPPAEEAAEGLDPDYLRRHGLVPLDRFGDLLTVAMPAVVPVEVLEGLAKSDDTVMAVVGSVVSNRHWLDMRFEPEKPAVVEAEVEPVPEVDDGHLPTLGPLELPNMSGLDELDAALPSPGDDESWADLFEAGDEAVRLNLEDGEPDPNDAP